MASLIVHAPIEPQPANEAGADGRLSLELGHVPAGKSNVLYIYFQVNPTSLGRRAANVTLYDGKSKLLQLRAITIFP
jgi:hypothetical protein